LVTFCHHRWCVKDLCLLITSIRSLCLPLAYQCS
jgi:hypothetical protein